MTDEVERETYTTDDDIDTTAPQSAPEQWKMPEPVFRKTSGRLPESFEKRAAALVSRDPEREDRSDSPATEPKPKSSVLKIVVLVLGVIAMIAFLVVFLTVVYFFFLK